MRWEDEARRKKGDEVQCESKQVPAQYDEEIYFGTLVDHCGTGGRGRVESANMDSMRLEQDAVKGLEIHWTNLTGYRQANACREIIS